MDDVLLCTVRVSVIALLPLPLLTLAHELGHAAAALLLTDGPVRAWLEPKNREPSFHAGRLYLRIMPFTGLVGFCSFAPGIYTKRTRAAKVAAGPLSSLVFGAIAIIPWLVGPLASTRMAFEPAVLIGMPSAAHGISTAIPFTFSSRTTRSRRQSAYAGMASDGLKLFRLLRPKS